MLGLFFEEQAVDLKPRQKQSADKYKENASFRNKIIKAYTAENKINLKNTPRPKAEILYANQRDRYARFLLNAFNPRADIDLESTEQELNETKKALNGQGKYKKVPGGKEEAKTVKDISFDPNIETELKDLSSAPLNYLEVVNLKPGSIESNPEITPEKVEDLNLLKLNLENAIRARINKSNPPLKLQDLGKFFIEYETAKAFANKKPLSKKNYQKIQKYWNLKKKELTAKSANELHLIYKKMKETLTQGNEEGNFSNLLAHKEMNKDSLLRLALSIHNELPKDQQEKFLLHLIPLSEGKYELEMVEYDLSTRKYKRLGEEKWQDLKEDALYHPEFYYLLELRKSGGTDVFSFLDLEAVRAVKVVTNDCVTCTSKTVAGAPTTLNQLMLEDLKNALDKYKRKESDKKKENDLPKTSLSLSDIIELTSLIPKEISLKDILSLLINFGMAGNLSDAMKFAKENKEILKELIDLRNKLPEGMNVAELLKKVKKEKLGSNSLPTSAELKMGVEYLKQNPQAFNKLSTPRTGTGPSAKLKRHSSTANSSVSSPDLQYKIHTKRNGRSSVYSQDEIDYYKRLDQLEVPSGTFEMLKKPSDLEFFEKAKEERQLKFDNYNCDNHYDYVVLDDDDLLNEKIAGPDQAIFFSNYQYYQQYIKLTSYTKKRTFLDSLLLKKMESCIAKYDFSFLNQFLEDPFSRKPEDFEKALTIVVLFQSMNHELYRKFKGRNEIDKNFLKKSCEFYKTKFGFYLEKTKKAKAKIDAQKLEKSLKKDQFIILKNNWENIIKLEEALKTCPNDTPNLNKTINEEVDLEIAKPWYIIALESDYERGPTPQSKVDANKKASPIPPPEEMGDQSQNVTIIPSSEVPSENFYPKIDPDRSAKEVGRNKSPQALLQKTTVSHDLILSRAVIDLPAKSKAKHILPPLEWYKLNQDLMKNLSPEKRAEFLDKWGPGIFMFYYRYNKANPTTPLPALNGTFFRQILDRRNKEKTKNEKNWIEFSSTDFNSFKNINITEANRENYVLLAFTEDKLPLDLALYVFSVIETKGSSASQNELEFKKKLEEKIKEKLNKY